MASEKISDMTPAASVVDADIFPIVASGANKSSAMSLLKTYLTGFFSKFSFKTISVSGQSDVVADSDSDTLTLVAGSNITLTTNASTDTVTIASSGSGSPGGSDTEVQWNNSGSFDGITSATTDGTTLTLASPAITTPTGIVNSDVGLGNVTNDAQTKAAIVPNTAPTAGKILVGNAGGTAYAPVSLSGSGATIALASTGVATISAIANATLSNSAITVAGTSTSLGGSITLDTITGVSSNGLLKRTGANTLTNVTAPSGAVVGDTDTQTLTNKRVTKRVTSTSGPGATPTINTDNCDAVHFTAVAAAITSMTTNLSGTPVQGDMLRIDFTDDGTARAITWGTSFEASTVALPTTTVISTRLDVGFIWNTVSTKWRCVAVA